MFTGLIETVGTVAAINCRGNYRVLRVTTADTFGPLDLGESVACDGVCLTVVESGKAFFVVEASQETIERTILSSYAIGTGINLERALQAGSRLGGHFVTGHVDAIGSVQEFRQVGESWELAVGFPREHDRLVVEKGSIAINGVSLTVNHCEPGRFLVNLIPFTLQATTLRQLRTGARVNLEFDLLGKYILKAVGAVAPAGLTMDKLHENGW